ncbi:MAG: hypothetical protein JNM07_04300 [Phycisphaerae bacterium]|nr:hypothetical protein [Phycisphaerae bacterium]
MKLTTRIARVTLGLLAASPLPTAIADPPRDYRLEIVAQTDGTLTSIDDRVSINNQGWIGFSGVQSGVSKAFVSPATGSYQVVAQSASSDTYLGGSINNLMPAQLATRKRVSGPLFFAYIFNTSNNSSTLVSGTDGAVVSSVLGFPDIDDEGYMITAALTNSSTNAGIVWGSNVNTRYVRSFGPTSTRLRPQLSNTDEAVLRDQNGRILLIDYLVGADEVIAPAPGNAALALVRPGVSADAHAVGYVTDVGQGQGVYLSVRGTNPDTSAYVRYTLASTADGYAFPDEQRVGVWTRVNSDDSDYRFAGAVFAAIKDGVLGVYTSSVSIFDKVAIPVGPPVLVMKVGDVVDGRTISSISLYDPVDQHGNIAVLAGFSSGGTGIVRATPRTHILASGVDWGVLSPWHKSGEYFIHAMLPLIRAADVVYLPLDDGDFGNIDTVKTALDAMYARMKPDDRLVFYINSHGSGRTDENGPGDEPLIQIQDDAHDESHYAPSSQDESICMSKTILHGKERWTDDQFADYFADPSKPVWSQVDKLFVLNQCYSGGFWNGGPADTTGDLSRLGRVALLAGATESGFAKTVVIGVKSNLVHALERAVPGVVTQAGASLANLVNAVNGELANFSTTPGLIMSEFPSEDYWDVPVLTTEVAVGHSTSDFTLTFGAPPGPCPGDFNGDTSLDDFDYFDFLNAFFANDISADFNGDTSVDDFDFFDFLNAFGAGC